MIQKQTAYAIVCAYQEIEAGEQLLAQLEEPLRRFEQPDLRDGWGLRCGLSLGVPTGPGASRLLDVPPRLAAVIIRAHIGAKRAELEALNLQARNEAEGADQIPVAEEEAKETR